MATVPIARLRAFARIIQRPRRTPAAWRSRVAGVVEPGSGTITWTPNEPWEGPVKPVSVEDYLRIGAKGRPR